MSDLNARPAWPAQVTIRDVGPRDGLQPEEPLPVTDRIRLVESLMLAGVSRIEAVAFVSPRAVPAMAGAGEVLAGLSRPEGVRLAALVPNRRGAEMALESGVHEITVTVSFSETYNQRNVKMSVAESEEEIAAILALTSPAEIAVDAVISCAFGSPYEGDADPAEVLGLADRLLSRGVDTVTYADTTGVATPRRIHDLADALQTSDAHLRADVGLHLHDTRGSALANVVAAIERGIIRFDTSIGGLGGSPFAHGAGGNLATETLVAVLDDMGIETGISIGPLIEAALLVEELVGRPVPSGVAHHGPRNLQSD